MKKVFVKGALALGAFGAVLAGCNNSDNGGPSTGSTATPGATTTGTANATASGTASATANGTATARPGATATATPGTGPAATVVALARVRRTSSNSEQSSLRLLVFGARNPRQILRDVAVSGISGTLGIDYRPATRQLYALSGQQLFTLNTSTGAATAVGSRFDQPALSGPNSGFKLGFDFNPVADRIRVVSDLTLNFRLNPDTGQPVDSNPNLAGLQRDPNLTFDAGDRNASITPRLAGAAYSNNFRGATSTTNFAIDTATSSLVTQGTRAGTTPIVSPNTGRVFTVGSLGVRLGATSQVSFDIGRDAAGGSGVSEAGLAAIDGTLYNINLSTGAATRIDQIGSFNGISVLGLSIVP